MSEPWVLVPADELAEGAELELEAREARHLVSARRAREGQTVVVADGAGHTARAQLVAGAGGRVSVRVEAVAAHPPPGGPQLELALAVLQGSAMDEAVQRAVEVGVRRLLPVVSERVQGRDRVVRRRLPHWRQVATEALKQCRRPWAMELAEPVDLEHLAEAAAASPVVASMSGDPLWRVALPCAPVVWVVGPEGGFTPAELRWITARGWPASRLGPHVLRAGTAAVCGVVALRGELDRRAATRD